MKTNEQIRADLGDDGRVRRKCETCGGSGGRDVPIDEDDYENHGNSRLLGTLWHSCDDCDGGWVYDDRRLADAVFDWAQDSDDFRQFTATSMFTEGVPMGKLGGHVWNNRHNQPWQAALEAAVDAYIEPAPDYKADPEALKAALRQGGWLYRTEWFRRHEAAAWLLPISDDNNGTGTGDTEAEALWNAVQAAMENGTADEWECPNCHNLNGERPASDRRTSGICPRVSADSASTGNRTDGATK